MVTIRLEIPHSVGQNTLGSTPESSISPSNNSTHSEKIFLKLLVSSLEADDSLVGKNS